MAAAIKLAEMVDVVAVAQDVMVHLLAAQEVMAVMAAQVLKKLQEAVAAQVETLPAAVLVPVQLVVLALTGIV
jgi:hypothetical protein